MMQERPTICCILPTLAGGGAERVALTLADGFAARGARVVFLLLQAKGAFLEEARAHHDVVDLGVGPMRLSVPPLVRALKQLRPDAILSFMWPLNCYAAIAHRAAGRPGRIVLSEHNHLSTEYAGLGWTHRALLRASIRLIYPLAHARVAVSRGVANDVARLGGISANGLSILYNPIPYAAAAPGDPHAEAVWGDGARPRVVNVGSFKPQKNQALLIDAFARFAKGGEGTLLLLGEGPLRPQLEAQIARLGLQKRVLMPGFFAEPAPFYASADLFVLASNHEGFGNVLVEAMQQGLNIVSTDCRSGPDEILRDGLFGRLVPVGDADALATAMRDAIADPTARAALIARARDFEPEATVQHYLDLLLPGNAAPQSCKPTGE